MKTRVISALVGLPLFLGIIYFGGNVLFAACLLLSLVGTFEFYNAFRNMKINAFYLTGYAFTVIYYLTLYMGYGVDVLRFLIFAFVVLLMGIGVFSKRHNFIDVLVTIGGFLYVTFLLSHVYMVSRIDHAFFVWLIFILAWVTDTSAYFSGYFFGNTKLIPDVSPKKTVEGAIGGVVGTLLVTMTYTFFFNREFLVFSVFLGLLGGICSQIGDLMASKIKRFVDIKDFGNLMPGHGGVLDRFDSILITAPLVYYFAVLYQALPSIYLVK